MRRATLSVVLGERRATARIRRWHRLRVEELRALQGFLPVETWVEGRYDVELKNNLTALRNFDLNQGLLARKKWADAIARGDHYVPGLPLDSSPDLMELV